MEKTIEEVRNWLLENRVDECGNLDLEGLDFSDFDGDVYISGMKVKGNLCQNSNEVQGDLYQSFNEVQGDLNQHNHEVHSNYCSKNIKVKGNIDFEEPKRLLEKITLDKLKEMGYELV